MAFKEDAVEAMQGANDELGELGQKSAILSSWHSPQGGGSKHQPVCGMNAIFALIFLVAAMPRWGIVEISE